MIDIISTIAVLLAFIFIVVISCSSLHRLKKDNNDVDKLLVGDLTRGLSGGLTGGGKDSIEKIITEFVNTVCPTVQTITNYEFQRIDLNNFVWSPKRDGLHRVLLIKGKEVFEELEEGRWSCVKVLQKAIAPGNTVIEVEDMEDKYIILDVHVYKGVNVSDLPYTERLQKSFEGHVEFEKQTINNIISAEDLLKHANEFVERTDGIILTSKNTKLSETICYKIKPRTLYTIDVLMKKDERGVYVPYVRCRSKFNALRYVDTCKFGDDDYCTLSVPHINRLRFDPKIEFVEQPGFPVAEASKAEIKEMVKQDLDNKIVEVLYNGVQLYPLRIRNHSNVYSVSLRIMDNIFAPIKAASTDAYFKPVLNSAWSDYLPQWHELSRIMRMNFFKLCKFEGRSIFDVAGGRGACIPDIVQYGFKNLFIEDADNDALTRYIEKFRKDRTKPRGSTLNVVFKPLSTNNREIYKDITSRREFPRDGIDCGIMCHAFHYLCDDMKNITALRALLKGVLKKGATFAILDFDYEAILAKMKENGENKLKLGLFEIVYNPDTNMILMPVPSFDESGYRAEPVIRKEHLQELGEYETIDIIEYREKAVLTEYLQYVKAYKWTF